MFAQVWLRLACLWCPSGRADQRLRADLLRGCPAGPLVRACLSTVATLSRLPGFRTRRSTFACLPCECCERGCPKSIHPPQTTSKVFHGVPRNRCAILAGMARKPSPEALNKLFASRGGKARAAKLTAARRLEIATKASAAAKAKREADRDR